jgi:hypothetical protein
VETLPKKLPNRGYSRRDVNILSIGAKDCGGGIPTEQSEYAKLEPRGNNQDERRKVENPHAVAAIAVAIMAPLARECQNALVQAVLSEPELPRAMFDVGYFSPNTPPTPR